MNNKFPIKKYNKFLEYFRDYNQSLNDTVNNINQDLLKIYDLIEIAIKLIQTYLFVVMEDLHL